jgi:hypothetical protein
MKHFKGVESYIRLETSGLVSYKKDPVERTLFTNSKSLRRVNTNTRVLRTKPTVTQFVKFLFQKINVQKNPNVKFYTSQFFCIA